MRTAYSVETVRAAERALMARLPEGALMQRAAAGLAAACAGLLGPGRVYGARIALLVGSGDNGGDALYAGARLARRGAGVTAVLLSADRTHAGGLAALRAAGGWAVPAAGEPGETAGPGEPGESAEAGTTETGSAETRAGGGRRAGGRAGGRGTGTAGRTVGRAALAAVRRADLVLDGIVGIGGHGGLRPAAAGLALAARESGAAIVAVDLPSGMEADTGEITGTAVRADATVTFGTYKPGLLIDPGAGHTGALRLVDIGLAPYLPDVPELEAPQHADVAALLPVPTGESDKYRRGVTGVVAGSARYPGAAVLAVAGALRGGAGAVRYVGPAGDAVIARFPETLVHGGPPAKAGRVQSWAVGPGLGDGPEARRAVKDVLASDVPVLVDADGLRLLDRKQVRRRTAPTLLTPHAGEAAALLGVAREEVEASRLSSVRRLAAEFGATVLLKGSTTLVAAADGPVRANPTGTGWLATAGTGDVLSGLTASLLAAGLEPRDAASAGAYLHGLAGRLAAGRTGAPVGASDVAAALVTAWRDVASATA
ncbi:NAD(P)H-hydrate dehydratase [Streptomyces sp. S07_1.15]|uniref:NAD(P)H-hydrate dehydratase n=1 Tax=Streptomyces sp. S07_1.15 TaxID=2873925 RepID=UPI001D13BAFE|nr:NAD(P)H-hydrate dehydratase [Streptomyces sp. S07_1.15]MCC3652249.1 NAD(P)H-hydrate dehydratase [Streptomyces sp. S07_1.15]